MNRAAFSFVAVSVAAFGLGQDFLMMPDSTNNRIVTFDATTGALINSNLFTLAGGTPIHAMQVGEEVWVSEQLGDRISRWSITGTSLGAVTGGMDNIRGMGLIGGTVYVTNGGSANGAPSASSVIKFDTSGNNLGFFSTAGTAPSPFGIIAHQGGMLVSSSSANNDIHRYDSAGNAVSLFHNSTSLNFGEQMDHDANGNILVAGFSSNNVLTLDSTSGAVLSSFTASGARGVYRLGNGNIMWTSGTGVFIYNGTSSTQIYTGGGRYIAPYAAPVPEPATMIGLALGGVALLRRRRSK